MNPLVIAVRLSYVLQRTVLSVIYEHAERTPRDWQVAAKAFPIIRKQDRKSQSLMPCPKLYYFVSVGFH